MKKFCILQNVIYFLRNIAFLCLLLLLSFTVTIRANAIEQNQFFQDDIPTIKYSVTGPKLIHTKDAKGTFSIRVAVPKDHHAYLDKGDKGIFIPLKFDFSGVESAGYKIALTSRPKGVYDNEVNARILRGKGEFKFSIHRLKGREFIFPPIRARSQICNDITKICYFPRTDDIPLIINIK